MTDIPCPICQRADTLATKKLYQTIVCKKCSQDLANRRHTAYFLDSILLLGACYLLGALWGSMGVGDLSASVLSAIQLLAVFAFLARDVANGRSPGKRLSDLQTVDASTGEPIGLGKSLLRNLILLVPFMILVDGMVLKRGSRIGDKLAGTMVVRRSLADRFLATPVIRSAAAAAPPTEPPQSAEAA